MALTAFEVWDTGFVRNPFNKRIVVTFNRTGATWQAGYVRDPDGRLVVVNA